MTRILLVHGSCHGAWAWDTVLPLLRAAGHEARALDMPGRGTHPVPLAKATLNDFAATILDAAAAGSVLVGHSAGGFAITAAAEAAPAKIARLIYVCAFVPRPGQSLADMRRLMTDPPLAGAICRAADGASYEIAPEKAGSLFYHDLPADMAAAATARLCPEPTRPQAAALPGTARAEALPRRYILCEEDRTILPHVQDAMVAGWPAAHVARMSTGHSPFLADPERLARHILTFLDD